MKNWRLWILIIGAGLLSVVLPAHVSQIQALVQQPPTQLNPQALNQQARSITVKILSTESLGSGIIVRKQGSVYTVLTNAHVLAIAEPPYTIQTPDEKIYETIKVRPLEGNDLALLQFSSRENYTVAKLGRTPAVGTYVSAAGFPFSREGFQNGGFVVKTGEVKWVLEKALEGGYQIGYTNDIEKGMSGGPLLNRVGEVIGINGVHAHPIWGDPYLFKDGSEPSVSERQKMSQFSWGIPAETFEPAVSRALASKEL